MQKKLTAWKTKGMNRDLSVSAFNSEFAFENRNLRLSTNDDNTQLSWVNERGPKKVILHIDEEPWNTFYVVDLVANTVTQGTSSPAPILWEDVDDGYGHITPANYTTPAYHLDIALKGAPIGTATINHKLVVFTHSDSISDTNDRIYLLWYDTTATVTTMLGKVLYCGNLNFSIAHPIETLVSYESENIQKVYWVDGENQPRVINVAVDNNTLAKWNPYPIPSAVATYFNFLPCLNNQNSIVFDVTRNEEGGYFAPGVIQYCITYYNKYGQESNVAAVSSLYYISHKNRGASADEMVGCSFNIHLQDLDSSFEYVRLYSIQRTSQDDTVFAKLLRSVKISDIPTGESGGVDIVDTGTIGSSIDSSLLLLVGGHEITALTMTEKNNTLFLGNIEQKAPSTIGLQDYYITHPVKVNFTQDAVDAASPIKTITLDHIVSKEFYGYTPLINKSNQDITTFKGGENYRFGFQLQSKTGEWSEPIWLGEDETNLFYPKTYLYSDKIRLTYATASLSTSVLSSNISNFSNFYSAIRPLVVFPDYGSRKVIMQGVLNPTVFNVRDREDKVPFAQASWFFRPYGQYEGETKEIDPGTIVAPSTEENAYGNQIQAEALGGTAIKYIHYDSLPSENYNVLGAGWTEAVKPRLHPNSADASVFMGRWVEGSGGADASFASNYEYFIDFSEGEPLGSLSGDKCLAANVTHYLHLQINPNDHTHQMLPDTDPIIALELFNGPNSAILDINYEYSEVASSNGFEWKFSKRKFKYKNIYGNSATTGKANAFRRDLIISFRSSKKIVGLYFCFIDEDSKSLYDFNTEDYKRNYQENTANEASSHILYKVISAESQNVEIQGATARYITVFEDTPSYNSEERKADTQFFVDQSIITFNSPDLEYDTTLQALPSDDYKLRIIGAIPITGSASGCDINASNSQIISYENGNEEDKMAPARYTSKNTWYGNVSYFAQRRLCSEYMWNDSFRIATNSAKTSVDDVDYLIFPWHKNGSIANTSYDTAVYSELKKKQMSNTLFSLQSLFFNYGDESEQQYCKFENLGCKWHLNEDAYIKDILLEAQRSDLHRVDYYPNIDTTFINTVDNFVTNVSDTPADMVGSYTSLLHQACTVSMRYNSNTHAAISLRAASNSSSASIPILPKAFNEYVNNDENAYFGEYIEATGPLADLHPFWDRDGNEWHFTQSAVDISSLFGDNPYGFLWLGELYQTQTAPFGGTSKDALRENTWLIGGDTVSLTNSDGTLKTTIPLLWTRGDTYYQRYDCMKTYAHSNDDPNQVIEILSFMCESRVNLDGRYDANRGLSDSYMYSPVNFGLMNPIYSQLDNYFNYKIVQTDERDVNDYKNWITWSMSKTAGAETDEYTHITLASVLNLDGNKGQITALRRFNDQIVAFQEMGISQILYDESVQIASTTGVPIEIANSGKVQGARYISDTVGCSNKWGIAASPAGLYFLDSEGKNIWLYNGGLTNVSQQKGFNAWAKTKIPSSEVLWNPRNFDNFVSYYDKLNQEVHFINADESLAFSETIGNFTSFYDYGRTPYFINLDSTGLWVREQYDNTTPSNITDIYQHQTGDYGIFFGEGKPYSMTLIGNPNPLVDKVFTNLEFRATVDGEGNHTANPDSYTPYLPFDILEVWNEYQHGAVFLRNMNEADGAKHHKLPANANNNKDALKRKFRMWRCDIPRDNLPISSDQTSLNIKRYTKDSELGITRYYKRPLDRMRNPWIYIKLKKDAESTTANNVTTYHALHKAEIHDMVMTYFE